MIDMEITNLSDFFTTKSEAINFAAGLSVISEKIFETDFNLEKTLQEQLGVQKKDKFLSLLRKNEIPLGSNSALSSFLKTMQENTFSLPTVYLILAIEPKEEMLKAVSDWFALNLKKQVLIDIQIQPNLIAGAAVSFQGKQLNASIKTLFDEVCSLVLDNKDH